MPDPLEKQASAVSMADSGIGIRSATSDSRLSKSTQNLAVPLHQRQSVNAMAYFNKLENVCYNVVKQDINSISLEARRARKSCKELRRGNQASRIESN